MSLATQPDLTTGGACIAPPVVGVDVLSPTLRAADAVAHALVARLRADRALDGAVLATHLTRLGPLPHVTLSVEAPDLAADALAALVRRALPEALLWEPGDRAGRDPAAAAGAAAHAERTGGRLVHFPGVERLVGTLPVADLLARSAVDDVRVLGGHGAPDPAVPLVTRGHVRPSYDSGRVVLVAEWAVGGALVPFETPNPTPCCADHA